MRESSGEKDSIIISSELCPERYDLKLARAAAKNW
jgi:hypothetical protein